MKAWISLGIFLCAAALSPAQSVTGLLTKWETVTIDFEGPHTHETAGDPQTPNPFTDYRLQVEFAAPSGATYDVPGFFDGDGRGGATGSVWRVRFTPDEVGQWSYRASFREGQHLAAELNAVIGKPNQLIDGQSGSFTVSTTSPTATGHFATGRLEYAGGHYLKSRDGRYWIKSGADSPENFLGYRGFDNTQTKGADGFSGRLGILHDYAPHSGDWRPGDPAWDSPDYDYGNTLANGGDARNLIGYLNYLSKIGVNSQYFLVNNIGGDGKDCHPFAGITTPDQLAGETNTKVENDNLHYDVSKLAQWEIVFRHAQQLGIHLHMVLNEAELANKHELDDGKLGIERKIFYRELVARFGHHNALQWNLCEEYDLKSGFGPNIEAEAERINEFANYLSAIDPYHHPLTVHNNEKKYLFTADAVSRKSAFKDFLGDEDFDLPSIQRPHEAEQWSDVVEAVREATTIAGRPWVVMIDEPESITRINVGVNDDTEPGTTNAERFNTVRKTMLWDILLSGAGGVEWFIHDADQDVEHARLYEQVYVETAHARRFIEEHLPFWEMEPNDDLVRNEDPDYGGAEVFYKQGEVYAFYLPDGSNDDGPNQSAPEIDLRSDAGQVFLLRWFNPRTGQFEGTERTLTGGDWTSVGPTPDGFRSTNDWAALLTLVN